MMKILRAVAFATAASAATVHAAPESPTFATLQMADVHDVTQAWYFTGEALSGHGAPWADGPPALRSSAETALAPARPAAPAAPMPARIEVPPTIPEPDMASMLLVGLALICLRVSRKEDLFG